MTSTHLADCPAGAGTGRGSAPAGRTPFSEGFIRTRRSLAQDDHEKALLDLFTLEEEVCGVFFEVDKQARAVADANVRAVELAERLSRLTEQLEAQNRQLQQQNHAIEEAKRELELQSRAVAEANIDAVLEAETARARVSRIEGKQAELEAKRVELEQKAREFEEEAAALASANAEAVLMVLETEEEKKSLQEKVFVDELTGLFNHRYFREQLKFEFARARRYDHSLSLVFLDLDHFKKVNDSYGHAAGDRVLQRAAELVRSQLRTSDIPVRVGSEPVPARYGGEEVVVILPETDLDAACAMAERIRAVAETQLGAAIGDGENVKATLSAGVACLCAEDAGGADLVRRADEALYRAKDLGRNRVEAAR